MKTRGLSRLVILAVFLGVSGLVVAGYTSFRKDVAAMQAASLEDITWMSYQLEQELAQFRDALTRFQIEDGGADTDEVNNRFDILWSRVAVFQQGRIGKRLLEYDEETQIIAGLFEVMTSVDRKIVHLAEDDIAEAKILLAEFAPFTDLLRTFSRKVTLGEELKGREIREQLQSGVNRTLLMGVVAIAIILASLAYINRESIKNKKLAETNLKLAGAAEKASRVKSQFLTMMSHELRTPMNGVLGSLALSKQSATQPSQIKLLDQAEHSGHQMVGLLADIMDFSELQSDTLVLDKTPFEIAHLSRAVQERFEPLAKREGIEFQVSASTDCPKKIYGDFRRMRQAFSHLAQYIVETAGVRDIEMNFTCAEGALNMRLSFDYLSSGEEWLPDLIMGGEARGNEKFESDALGPAIARGYIEAMNGTIVVENPTAEKTAIVASVPIEEFEEAAVKEPTIKETAVNKTTANKTTANKTAVNVSLMANSEAMAAIYRATIQGDGIVFIDDGDNADVHIVLIESGNASEIDFIVRAAIQFPNALLIALGRPLDKEAFDFSLDLPLDNQKLREIMIRQIA